MPSVHIKGTTCLCRSRRVCMGFREGIERTVHSEKEKKERRPQNAPKLDTAGTEPRCSATGEPLQISTEYPIGVYHVLRRSRRTSLVNESSTSEIERHYREDEMDLTWTVLPWPESARWATIAGESRLVRCEMAMVGGTGRAGIEQASMMVRAHLSQRENSGRSNP
jgi:hypothetical protein